MTRSRPLRVLWVPYAQRGSVYPIAPLIERLRGQGSDILLLGLRSLERLAVLLGVDFQPYSSGIVYDWSRPEGCDRHGLGPRIGAGWFAERVAEEYAEVTQTITAFRPDVMLADSFVIGAGFAAEASGVPWGSYVHYLFDESADVDAVHRIWWEGPGHELDAYLSWWDGLRRVVGLGPETRPPEDAPWYRMSPVRTFLLGHPRLRREGRPLPGYVTRTSFPPWDEPRGDDDRAYRWSGASGRPRVLVANSSAWQDDFELVRAALVGLADLDIEVVVTVSTEHVVDVDVPPNAAACDYIPHSRLLPRIGAVVSTSGYGLVSKSLWWGRPLVLAPLARDQHYVAEAVEATGCGVRVGWPPTHIDLRKAVETAIGSVAIRERARRMSGPAPGYPGPAQVARMLLDLAGRR